MPVILGCLDLVTFVAWHLIANPLLGCVTGGDGRDSHCTCHPASVSLKVSFLGTHGMFREVPEEASIALSFSLGSDLGNGFAMDQGIAVPWLGQ